jgi:hypothetical protein
MYNDINLIKTPANKPVNFIPYIAVAITTHDTNTFQEGLLWVGVGGDVKAMPAGLATFVTFKNVPSGSFLPIYVKAVHTDTTATDMLICY